MSDFDKTGYWRKRSLEKMNTLLADTNAFFKDLRTTFIHIEGVENEDLKILMSRLDIDYTEVQRLIMVMGKPKVEAKHEEKKAGKDNKAPQNPEGNK